ncbi:hypothetical protein D9Q98_004322 [Chlorella vulgaris]|uniref:Thioredoxin domain-containing protein n=1 Tax=Chlorella vulgaris TaxID=3077 RepID=A0A9D4TQQ2_CHLVU|nr:hypothetical protein D9Q98_004322 [Chlorella vulgaris]
MQALAVAAAGRLVPALASRPAPRSSTGRHPAVARLSREDELAKMAEFKSGLAAKLETVRRGGPTAAGAGAAAETEAAAPAAAPPGKTLREVTHEDYYAAIEAAGDKLVVVDCYTEWCGPCKMILPTLVEWSEELSDKIEIVKFNCNKHNKDLGVSLGIKVAPTFLLYKGGEIVDKMTGAKTEQLRELIEKHI